MDELENYLHKTREFVEEIIDSDFGLIGQLNSKGVLNRREMQDIKAENTCIKRSSMLLDIITRKKKIPDLCEALIDTGQQHIVNYLNACGERSPQFDDVWPLTEKEISILESNQEGLIDILDTCDLIGRLYSDGVINRRHVEFISSRSTFYEKSEALLEILRRCSLHSYGKTIKCLRESNQNHIAEILERGGAIVPVHATVETDNLDETEEQIVDEMANLLTNMSPEQANRLLTATQLKIIAVNRGRSIVLYISCSNEDELNRLCKMIDNLKMKKFLEQLFNLIILNTWIKIQSVKIFERDLGNTKQFFKRMKELKNKGTEGDSSFTSKEDSTPSSKFGKIAAEVENSQMKSTNINSIPLELIDVIIQKSFAIFIQMKNKTLDGKFLDGFKQLAEVNVCWFKRMTKRRFKNDRWSYLSGICELKYCISTIWKNNRQFIEDNVFQIKTGANRLKNHDLLSDIECALIARKSFNVKKIQDSNKATDISLILNYKDWTITKLFSYYLHFSERRWNSETIRDCGTSVRVEVNSRRPIEDEKITRFFKDSGSESLGSVEDRDFVRWIWCKSSDSKELQQSKYLRHPFCHLIEGSSQRVHGIRVNVDSDQMKKKTVALPLLFDESLETIDEQSKAVGVTKLRNEFYCLNDDGVMKVFCDRYPFVLLRKFQLKEIEGANDIVSCEKENALYILDIGSHWYIHLNHHVCVWKIEQNSKTSQSEIKWLELSDGFQPLTLSMSKNCQLLMVSKDPSPSLRIYGSYAQLRFSIALHKYIQLPIHAVETSTGNFVILHLLEKEDETAVTTLSRDGKTIVHNYQPENWKQRLIASDANYLSIDSNDRVFVADYYIHRVIFLDSNLRWNQILFSKNEEKDEDSGKKIPIYPRRLYYDEGEKQLFVAGSNRILTVFLNKF